MPVFLQPWTDRSWSIALWRTIKAVRLYNGPCPKVLRCDRVLIPSLLIIIWVLLQPLDLNSRTCSIAYSSGCPKMSSAVFLLPTRKVFNLRSVIILASLLVFPMLGCRHSLLQYFTFFSSRIHIFKHSFLCILASLGTLPDAFVVNLQV